MISLNEKGFPQITNLAIFAPTKTGQGNDFHNPATGQFTYAPAGVRVMTGSELLKDISATTRKLIFNRAKVGMANQLAARVIDGKLHIVLLRNGKKIDSFSVLPKSLRNKPGDQNADKIPSPSQIEGPIRDALLDAARDINLEGESLFDFLEEALGRQLGENERAVLDKQVRNLRIDDLVQYLHVQLRKKENGVSEKNTIRVAVPRGYVRKTFAFLNPEEVQEVFTRLGAMGWTEDVLQERVAEGLPAEIKKLINVDTKETDPESKVAKK